MPFALRIGNYGLMCYIFIQNRNVLCNAENPWEGADFKSLDSDIKMNGLALEIS